MKYISILCLFCLSARAGVYTTDPSDHFLTMVSNQGIVITNQITICVWLSRTAASSSIGGILSKGLQIGLATCNYNLGESSGGGVTNTLEFFYHEYNTASLSQWRTGDNAYTVDNALNFLAFTYNFADSNSVKMYLNGTSISGSWVANVPTGRGPTNLNTADVEVGQGQNSSIPCGGGARWTGYFSEVGIWNSVLTLDQLELIRKSKIKGIHKQINGSTLKLYLPLDSVPDSVLLIPQATANASEFPDRQNYGPKARRCAGATHPIGRGESVCSYYPNE